LKDDNAFIREFFARFKSPTTSPESKKNMVKSFVCLSVGNILVHLSEIVVPLFHKLQNFNQNPVWGVFFMMCHIH